MFEINVQCIKEYQKNIPFIKQTLEFDVCGRSLVNNIGHDDSGAHCDCTNAYDVNVSEDDDFRFTTDISESEEALMLMEDFYRSIRKPIYVLAYNQFKQMVKNFLNKLDL